MVTSVGIPSQYVRRAELAEAVLRRRQLLQDMVDDPLIDLRTARVAIPLGDSAARAWIRKGKLPVVRIGRRIFIRLSVIKKLREEGSAL